MAIKPIHAAGDGVVFGDDFYSPASVMDNNGVIVASTISRGISPTGVSGRVTYVGTESLLINATQMTLEMRFVTGSAAPPLGWCDYVGKAASALTDNQFFVQRLNDGRLTLYVANAAADTGQYISTNAALAASTEYVAHLVYNGALAVGLRGAIYLDGLVAASTITGTLPASMRAAGAPLTAFNLYGGVNAAPANDTILRSFNVFDFAMDAGAVADRAAYLMGKELTP